MAYARVGKDSDVYVVGTDRTENSLRIECMGCDLASVGSHGGRYFIADSARQMIVHLRLHIAAGQMVPQRTLDRLAEESEAEAKGSKAFWESILPKKVDEE